MKELFLDQIFPNTTDNHNETIIKQSIQLDKHFIFEKILFKNIGVCRMKNGFAKVIVKIQDIKANKKAKKAVTNEMRIIRQCQHPYIIQHLAVYTEGSLVMQFFPFYKQGDLLSKQRQCPLVNIQLRRVVSQLLLAIEYLHNKRVVHADIKPENVLCTNDAFLFDVKLIDFGNAEILHTHSSGGSRKHRLLGTFGYMAPEVMSNTRQSYPIDLWSLAVLIYALKSGRLPFGDNDDEPDDYKKRVSKCDVKYEKSIFGGKHSTMRDFLKSLLVVQPSKRKTATQCLTHPWICPTFERLTFR